MTFEELLTIIKENNFDQYVKDTFKMKSVLADYIKSDYRLNELLNIYISLSQDDELFDKLDKASLLDIRTYVKLRYNTYYHEFYEFKDYQEVAFAMYRFYVPNKCKNLKALSKDEEQKLFNLVQDINHKTYNN